MKDQEIVAAQLEAALAEALAYGMTSVVIELTRRDGSASSFKHVAGTEPPRVIGPIARLIQ